MPRRCRVLRRVEYGAIAHRDRHYRAGQEVQVNRSLGSVNETPTGQYWEPKNAIEDEWQSVIDSNLKSTFLGCQAALPHMVKQKYGRIVNISSLAARTYSYFLGAHYSAAKAGVLGLTRHIAYEYGPQGICANAVL